MNIVIVGCGLVGKTVTEQLSNEDVNIMLIDSDCRELNSVADTYDVMGVCGNGASYEIQIEADVPNADLLIAVTPSDEINILCCLLAKKLGAKNTIARVRNPEYIHQLEFMKEDLGLSMAINPELAAADEILNIIHFPQFLNVESFAGGKLNMVDLLIEEGNPLVGLKLSDVYRTYSLKLLICAVKRGKDVFIPNGDTVLQVGDVVTISTTESEIEKFFTATGLTEHKIRSVMIIGGSKIAFYLAQKLASAGISVKIIEKDEERCKQLCEMLPSKVSIIHGYGMDEDTLDEEGMDEYDAFIALTGIDEENTIISMYAKAKGVRKVITKINKMTLFDMIKSTDMDSIVFPKLLTSNTIVSYVRAMKGSFGSSVEKLHKIAGRKLEALEFKIKPNAQIIGSAFKDLKFKENNVLIAGIIRNGQVIIPDGNSAINAEDSVILVTHTSDLHDINDILR
ncbi:MAG: Trk system potassium transporter TrkA [Anaerofustis stercorihominis]|nr:Trk system potassium transporter TrkA [Anaerofustis stercorihominis]